MLVPLNNYVIVERRDEEPEKTEAGIYIPKDQEFPEFHTGIVKEAWSDHPSAKLLKKGDHIVYKHHRNTEYKGYECIKFEDIILIDNPDE